MYTDGEDDVIAFIKRNKVEIAAIIGIIAWVIAAWMME